MFRPLLLLGMITSAVIPASAGGPTPLWSHIRNAGDLGELRGLSAAWQPDDSGAVLALAPKPSAFRFAWVVIPPPQEGWNLALRATVEATIRNTGPVPASVLFWIVGDRGWDAVPDEATLAPGEERVFSCPLRDAYPDGTPKIDPAQVKQVQVMLTGRLPPSLSLEVRDLKASGEAPVWQRPAHRLDVPPVEDAAPAPGRRVRYPLPGEEDSGLYAVLYLPMDWRRDVTYPVIAEYPGNLYFTSGCYSTGLPDQCVIGYGMTKGLGAICLGLPFVDRQAGGIAGSGWGDEDETAGYALAMMETVCTQFGGDPANLFLTGFSRGALACGYIGLRNDRIAALWKGFHACQHYDGDGWNGATMEGALQRARRFRGRAVFHTDNSRLLCQPVMDAMQAEVTYVRSGLDAHATAMFLDDRPSTLALREWFANLVGQDP